MSLNEMSQKDNIEPITTR